MSAVWVESPQELEPLALSEAARAEIEQALGRYPNRRSAILPVLWVLQRELGWLPPAALRHAARTVEMPEPEVFGVATFYTMFNLEPVGRFHVQLCGTTPCVLRGADELIKLCRARIGEPLHVTADGTFSWIEVECLGACVNAPVAQINYDYYEDLTPDTFTRILDDLAAGKRVKPGPQVDRQSSAPQGGPTTLIDPDLYARGDGGSKYGAPLADTEAKKPGAAANVREASAPKPPIRDSSRQS